MVRGKKLQPETIELRGGALCLDFANSTDWTADGEPIEAGDALVEPDSLERWGRRLGLTGATAGGETALRELVAARQLRPALRSVLLAAADGEPPGAADLDVLTRTYAAAAAAAHLTASAGAYRLDWPEDDPRRVRFAIAADAIVLLADSDRLARVRLCPGRECGWVFLDTSGRRRWCSMDTCGSRAKMRAMYARRRAG